MKIEIKVNDKIISIDVNDINDVNDVKDVKASNVLSELKTIKLDNDKKKKKYKCKCGSVVLNKDWMVKRHLETSKHKLLMGV